MPRKLMQKYMPEGVKFSLKSDAPDERDHVFSAVAKAPLPQYVSLQAYAGLVEDQGNLSSCTGNALANAYETRLKLTQPDMAAELSRLFVYYNERALENTVNEDEGATIRSGIKTLKANGICTETTWPYQEDLWDDKPSEAAYSEGKLRTVLTYERLMNLDAMRQCLAIKQPFVFGIPIYGDKEPSPANNWTFASGGKQLLGYHALCCVGYDDRTKLFLVKNSWGSQWGMAGYCYVAYDMMQKEAMDAWTFEVNVVKPVVPAPVPVPKEPWWRRYLRFFSGY